MDEKNYKSIIQEYEELLTLVEVVKNDLPSIKRFQEDTLSLIVNSKKEISKSVENERKNFEKVLQNYCIQCLEFLLEVQMMQYKFYLKVLILDINLLAFAQFHQCQ